MEIGKWRAEIGARNPCPKDENARNCRPETGARQPNPREYQRFSPTRKKSAKIPNCVADEAVNSEPVSVGKFPASWENAGTFRENAERSQLQPSQNRAFLNGLHGPLPT